PFPPAAPPPPPPAPPPPPPPPPPPLASAGPTARAITPRASTNTRIPVMSHASSGSSIAPRVSGVELPTAPNARATPEEHGSGQRAEPCKSASRQRSDSGQVVRDGKTFQNHHMSGRRTLEEAGGPNRRPAIGSLSFGPSPRTITRIRSGEQPP